MIRVKQHHSYSLRCYLFVFIFALFTLISLVSTCYAAVPKTEQQQFITKMAVAVQQQNQLILQQRQRLINLYKQYYRGHVLSSDDQAWLKQLASQYRVQWLEMSQVHNTSHWPDEHWDQLLRRVDIIPTSLAVAQAINESGWGRSRFAKEGNNYYGQWCFTAGCGLVPLQRPADANYEVRKFNSVIDSVAAYMRNLNTQGSYHDLREKRAELRAIESTIPGLPLLPYLHRYSQLGAEYSEYIRLLILRNHLEKLANT